MQLIEAQNDYRTLYNRFNEYGQRLVVFQSYFGPTLGWAVGETTNFSPEMLEMGYKDSFSTKTWTSTREQAEASALKYSQYTVDNAHLNFRVQGVTPPPAE